MDLRQLHHCTEHWLRATGIERIDFCPVKQGFCSVGGHAPLAQGSVVGGDGHACIQGSKTAVKYNVGCGSSPNDHVYGPALSLGAPGQEMEGGYTIAAADEEQVPSTKEWAGRQGEGLTERAAEPEAVTDSEGVDGRAKWADARHCQRDGIAGDQAEGFFVQAWQPGHHKLTGTGLKAQVQDKRAYLWALVGEANDAANFGQAGQGSCH
jgi:hypothetical protein